MNHSKQQEQDWKSKLRFGKLTTPYEHYTVIAEGVVGELAEGYSCRAGSAFMSMKTWASSPEEATDMVLAIGSHIGFRISGEIHVFESNPSKPPGDRPLGYDIQFKPFDAGRGT